MDALPNVDPPHQRYSADDLRGKWLRNKEEVDIHQRITCLVFNPRATTTAQTTVARLAEPSSSAKLRVALRHECIANPTKNGNYYPPGQCHITVHETMSHANLLFRAHEGFGGELLDFRASCWEQNISTIISECRKFGRSHESRHSLTSCKRGEPSHKTTAMSTIEKPTIRRGSDQRSLPQHKA